MGGPEYARYVGIKSLEPVCVRALHHRCLARCTAAVCPSWLAGKAAHVAMRPRQFALQAREACTRQACGVCPACLCHALQRQRQLTSFCLPPRCSPLSRWVSSCPAAPMPTTQGAAPLTRWASAATQTATWSSRCVCVGGGWGGAQACHAGMMRVLLCTGGRVMIGAWTALGTGMSLCGCMHALRQRHSSCQHERCMPPCAARPQVKEIKNGRLAMVAFAGYFAQAAATGEGPLRNLLDFAADPARKNVIALLSGR